MKNTQWFYDPNKTFDQNMDEGPYFDHIPELNRTDKPRFDFLGFPIYLPFGIAAGTLPTSKHVKAAFDWGYDVATYKTMRSVAYPANQFPNIIPIETSGDVTLDQAESGLVKADDYPEDYKKIVITNSSNLTCLAQMSSAKASSATPKKPWLAFANEPKKPSAPPHY